MRLKDDYIIANCCSPEHGEAIIGYYSHNNIIKVHRKDCSNLEKAEQDRLVVLEWDSIIAGDEYEPDDDFKELDAIDLALLKHHRDYGFDYSLKVAAMMSLDKQIVFDHHAKLRDMGLLERIEPRMIQYRKNIVKGKWIKHRNHTYYDLTEKGRRYYDSFLKNEKGEEDQPD